MQERVVAAALERLEKTFDPVRDALVVEAGTPEEGWHRGVLGIAASKVAQTVFRPVLLLSREDGRVGGSGRTWGRTPLHERIAPVARRHERSSGGTTRRSGLSVAASAFADSGTTPRPPSRRAATRRSGPSSSRPTLRSGPRK
jgi:hypothetical protein